jgi:hypothetical protein
MRFPYAIALRGLSDSVVLRRGGIMLGTLKRWKKYGVPPSSLWSIYRGHHKKLGLIEKECRNLMLPEPENTALHRYKHHRARAKSRGILWELTFEEWWDIWAKSGKWEDRRSGGYCMARRGDVGPYSKDNVRIASCTENLQESHAVRQTGKRKS